MRAHEFINEDSWKRITPDDLPTSKISTPTITNTDSIENKKKIDTNKLPWWRKSSTNPTAVQMKQQLKTQGDLYAAIDDPKRVAKLSKLDPIMSGEVIRLDPNDPNWQPGTSIFGSTNLPRTRVQAVRDYRPAYDEYTANTGKQMDTLDKLPQVSPDSKMIPDVKIKRPQV